MREAILTSVVGESPEITAPIRREGQSDSEVLFTWLKVHSFQWMLEPPHDDELEGIVGSSVRLELGYQLLKWKRSQLQRAIGHEALVAPKEESTRRKAFSRLERLIEVHLLDPEGTANE